MVLKTFKRYELKYLINEEEFEAINHILKKKMDYDAYCLGGSRYISITFIMILGTIW